MAPRSELLSTRIPAVFLHFGHGTDCSVLFSSQTAISNFLIWIYGHALRVEECNGDNTLTNENPLKWYLPNGTRVLSSLFLEFIHMMTFGGHASLPLCLLCRLSSIIPRGSLVCPLLNVLIPVWSPLATTLRKRFAPFLQGETSSSFSCPLMSLFLTLTDSEKILDRHGIFS